MKTYAPKGLRGADLRALLADLHATPLEIAKFLQVTERSVWRWLKEENAPFAVLAALWHETPAGRHVTACDVGNEATLYRGLSASTAQALKSETARLGRLLAIADTGAMNDPLFTGPHSPPPSLTGQGVNAGMGTGGAVVRVGGTFARRR